MQELGGERCVPGLGSAAVEAHAIGDDVRWQEGARPPPALGGGVQAVASPISGTGSRRRDRGVGEGDEATGRGSGGGRRRRPAVLSGGRKNRSCCVRFLSACVWFHGG